jgi:uncharacterized membrane protein YfcA
MVARHHREIDRRLLLRGILPLMALGMPLGLWLAHAVDGRKLEAAFGVIVIALAARELVRSLRAAAPAPRAPLPAPLRAAALFCAGVVHGTFATGGPLVVWVADRAGLDKGRFRDAGPWAVLGPSCSHLRGGGKSLSAATARGSALLVVPVLAGLVAGEWLHARVDARPFRLGVLSLLCVAGR